MEIVHCQCCATSLMSIAATAFCTFLASLAVSYLAQKRQKAAKCIADKASAKAIIGVYLKEVEAGLEVLKSAATMPSISLPVTAWKCCHLTPDMIAVILQSDTDSGHAGFPVCDFLKHTVDYFEYLCPNVEYAVKTKGINLTQMLMTAQEAGTNVAEMFKCILRNLDENWEVKK